MGPASFHGHQHAMVKAPHETWYHGVTGVYATFLSWVARSSTVPWVKKPFTWTKLKWPQLSVGRARAVSRERRRPSSRGANARRSHGPGPQRKNATQRAREGRDLGVAENRRIR